MKFILKDRTVVPFRIFCIGKNYDKHIKELGDSFLSNEPVIFMKPISNIVFPNEVLFYPPYGAELHHEVEAVILIGKKGRNIATESVDSFITGVSIGLDLTLRDIQNKLKKSGLPWELSKSFEQSAPLGTFKPYDIKSFNLEDWSFSCSINGNLRQKGNTQEMILSIKEIIQRLSCLWTLNIGDIIFTGTPSGVGPLKIGDQITIESPNIGSFSWEIAPPQSS